MSVLLPRDWVLKTMGRSKGWHGVLNAVPPGLLPDVTAASGAEHITWFEHTAGELLVLCLISQLKPRGATVR